MRTPGITVRPLVLLNGHAHFNEVFFEDVKVPKTNLVGHKNEGWKVTVTTLMYERAYAGVSNYDDQIMRLVGLAKQVPIDGKPAWQQAWVRQRLVGLKTESESLKYTRLRGSPACSKASRRDRKARCLNCAGLSWGCGSHSLRPNSWVSTPP